MLVLGIDLGANSYKDANQLKRRIQSYIDKLDGIENKYKEITSVEGFSWCGSAPLHHTDYSSKLVEIVIPDMPLSDDHIKVLQEFLEAQKISIIIVK